MNTIDDYPMTDEFPADVKPVRPGVYETRYDTEVPGNPHPFESVGYSYFNGERWSYQHETIADAMVNAHSNRLARQDKRWRGIAVDPDAFAAGQALGEFLKSTDEA